MKSERRHELKENVLAHELVQFKDFYNKYGKWLITCLFVVLLGWLSYRLYRSSVNKTLADQTLQFDSAQNDLLMGDSQQREAAARTLADLARSAKDSILAGRAAARLGDYYVEELRRALPGNRPEADEHLANARRYYKLILDKHVDSDVLAARASFGLGALAQDLGEHDEARAHFKKVSSFAQFGSLLALRAKEQLAMLKKAPTSVSFSQPAAAPAGLPDRPEPPTTAATTEPASQPESK